MARVRWFSRCSMTLTLSVLASLFLVTRAGAASGTPPDAVKTARGKTPAIAQTDFNTYHGDSSLSGVAPTTLPEAPVRLWRYKAQSGIYSTPVVCDGRIFFSTGKGVITALDLQGKELWSIVPAQERDGAGPSGNDSFTAPPLAVSGAVIFGSDGGMLYAFDAASGKEKWRYEIGGQARIMGSPNWVTAPGGKTRIIAMFQPEGIVTAVDLATGEKAWEAESTDRCDGSPAASGKRVAFGNCNAAVHVLSKADGSYLNGVMFGRGSEVAGGVAIDGDQVFSGSRSGILYCGDMAQGEVVWENSDTEGELFTTPAVAGDKVVFSAADGTVLGLDRATGKTLWLHNTDGITVSSPVIAGNRVIVSVDGKICMLDLATGKLTWSFDAGDDVTSPAVSTGMIIVGSGEGFIMAFGAGGAK